jgi:hypothetical protein
MVTNAAEILRDTREDIEDLLSKPLLANES